MRKLIAFLMVLLIGTYAASAQVRTINGIVLDATNNEPLMGATVMPIGGGQGVATNVDGKFTIRVPQNVSKAKVSYVGYNSATVDIKPDMTVYLTSNTSDLDDVVVVAYGSQKKSSLTGAVTQINSETIEKRPVTSVTAALEGTTPGLTSTANYGAPGESSTIQIRGIGTVNGSNTPLTVVDGVPYAGSVSDINPEDVQSISILKDAASAALYGNRAANGVILITTKKAKSDRVQITFKTTQGWYNRGMADYETTDVNQWMNASYQDMLSTYVNTKGIARTDVAAMQEVHKYVRENFIDNFAFINIFNAADNELFDSNGNFLNHSIKSGYLDDLDWFDQAERTGYRGEYYLSGSGATSKSDYFFSLGYLSEDGYMTDANFRRLNGRAVINVNPVKWLKAGLTLSGTHSKQSSSMNGVGDGNDKVNNPFLSCRTMAPIYAVHAHNPWTGEYLYENGEKIYNLGHLDDVDLYNPATGQVENVAYWQVNNRTLDRNVIYESILNSDKTIKNTLNAIVYADFILPYGFTASVKGNMFTRNSENTEMGSAKIGDYVGKNGQLNKAIYNYKTWAFQQQLNWNQVYGDKHSINVLLGHENYSLLYDYTYNSKTSQAFPNIPALSNYSVLMDIDGYRNRYRTESYLARVQYNYDERYHIEASFRRDGSSRFAKDVRWGNFGSVGANWVFSNEEFMKDVDWLNFGKLRADWGQVGQDAGAGYYAWIAQYYSTDQAGLPAYYIKSNAATSLKWETGESWGVALEGRLFNRWNITLEYFDKRNKDLLFDVYSPVSQGTTATSSVSSNKSWDSVNMQNLGTISNRGIEITTDVDIFTNKDWTINLGANLSTLKNKVVKLPEQNKDGIDNTTQYIVEGKSRYEFYTRTYRGVDLATGQALYDIDFDKYHIVLDDGKIYGGVKQLDANGKPVLTENGKEIYTSTATTKYVLIDGKYYGTDYTQAERSFKGHAMPSVYGSFTPNIRFRDFSFSMMIYYSLGGQIYDSPYLSLMNATGAPRNHHVDVLKSWTNVPDFLLNADGTANLNYTGADRISTEVLPEFSSATSSHNNAASDRWLVSADYWQIKNINLTYTLPRKLTRSWGIDLLRLSFSAENVYTHTKRQGINPMMSMSGYQYNYMVPARVFTFGLNVNF